MKGTWREGSLAGIPFHRGPTGEPGRRLVYRDCGGRAPLLGTPKDMVSKALEMGVSIGAPLWGNMKSAPFLGPLREGKNFFY